MKIGLIGMPMTGKSVLFQLLTGAEPQQGKTGTSIGIAKVPDSRLDFLAAMYHPRKVTPANIQLLDTQGFIPGDRDRSELNRLLDGIRASDAFLHVVRGFFSPHVPPARGNIAPAADAEVLETELLLTDLQAAESHLERLRTGKKVKPEEKEKIPLLEQCVQSLEEGTALRKAGFSAAENEALQPFAFISLRPMLTAVNLDEQQLKEEDYPEKGELEAYCSRQGEELITFSAVTELEIASLEPEEREIFMAEYGIAEQGTSKLARAAYRALGLISFLTAGEDEVRAWPIRRGTVAQEAARKIHSDIARGFIRAEVVAFSDLKALGSIKAARERGLLRLEGKEYPVQDGDVINFRFNV